MNNKLLIIALMAVLMLSINACSNDETAREANELLVQRYFYEAMNQGDFDLADEIIASDFVKHNNNLTSLGRGPVLLKQAIKSHIENNTEYKFVIEEIISEGDKVTVRWVWRSKNKKYGDLKKVVTPGISIFRIEEGKIAELWQAFDLLSFYEQVGVIQNPVNVNSSNGE